MKSYAMSLFLLVFFLFFQPLIAEPTGSVKSFYSISALRFYLESKLTGSPGEELFEEGDVLQLWLTATEHSNSFDLALAKKNYDHALEGNDLETEKWLFEARDHLRKAWENLNPYWHHNTTVITAKGLDHRLFLLRPNSQVYKEMTRIFASPEILETSETFAKAGFMTVSERPSGMFVARHPRLADHLVKAFLYSKGFKSNWEWCIFRCMGAQNIRELINEKQLVHFTVPKKRIYPLLPINREDITEDLIGIAVPAVLVVTDMKLVKKSESRAAWKEKATRRHIQELYCILSHGYSSCCLPSNIPYTHKGKFSCIDTEHPQRSLPFNHVGRFLSEEMAAYWEYLVRTGGEGIPF